MHSTKLDFIRTFVSMGISIMPLYHQNKEPILSTWRYLQNQLPSEQEINSWFPTDWNNYAVICGWCNLVVIDFDCMDYYNVWKLWLSDTQYASLDAFQVRTRKGMHVYICTESPACNDKRISKSGGIDIQSQGKYVVGPRCVHPSGHVYEPIGELHFPIVPSVEDILPLDLFPRVRAEEIVYSGVAPSFTSTNTEYLCDPLTDTRDLISKVKASVRIENIFPAVHRSSTDGRWLKALCPFHDDHHESFWIDVRRQLCGCAVCGFKPMDILNLYARMHNISERAAVTALAEEVGIWR